MNRRPHSSEPHIDRQFFAQRSEAIRAAFAAGAGFEVGALDRDELTIVDRPESAPWPYAVMVTTFGLGTAVSVDPAYRSFVEALTAEPHHTAAWPGYLGTIATEAQARGSDVAAGPIALLWGLSELPEEPVVPAGLELRRVDRDWMNAEQRSGRFENGVGELGRSARAERNRSALALFAEDGEPVAVGGVFDTLGLQEIGVDVVPSQQRRGLAPIVVAAAARAVLEDGGTPLYACVATNIRSQRTALASGFVPVGADAFVS